MRCFRSGLLPIRGKMENLLLFHERADRKSVRRTSGRLRKSHADGYYFGSRCLNHCIDRRVFLMRDKLRKRIALSAVTALTLLRLYRSMRILMMRCMMMQRYFQMRNSSRFRKKSPICRRPQAGRFCPDDRGCTGKDSERVCG